MEDIFDISVFVIKNNYCYNINKIITFTLWHACASHIFLIQPCDVNSITIFILLKKWGFGKWSWLPKILGQIDGK